ncbi:hypothetical protein GNI_120730 [Gregarina niphandrodes]|uniref:Leucine rich repeat protein n=1 Tax=Gregarina niphandrodes TaxID=110365 RepID=A0A023B305_GRENI|nr:hypothetical protein GNI_120730 [Gregarina niphandrodes]EZG54458.1 hypothetical protein GNI_120730 [Gregarina niphandrodes]|eukprot:XP_011131845.1 hypothetical protein GNI_120730 [Gregarina niphandrodes]
MPPYHIDYTAVKQLPNLEQLSGVKQLPNLEQLSGVKQLPNLEQLSGVKQLPNLEQLSGVKQLPNLEQLSGVKQLPNLEQLPYVESRFTRLLQMDPSFDVSESTAADGGDFESITVQVQGGACLPWCAKESEDVREVVECLELIPSNCSATVRARTSIKQQEVCEAEDDTFQIMFDYRLPTMGAVEFQYGSVVLNFFPRLNDFADVDVRVYTGSKAEPGCKLVQETPCLPLVRLVNDGRFVRLSDIPSRDSNRMMRIVIPKTPSSIWLDSVYIHPARIENVGSYTQPFFLCIIFFLFVF